MIREALIVFELGVTLFPQSGNSYASLADAHLWNGDVEQARSLYGTALEKGAWGAARLRDRLKDLSYWQKILAENRSGLGYGVKSPRFSGPFLGQALPGSEPRLFAPGIVSLIGWSFSITFSPDGRELYYSMGNKQKNILFSRWEPEGWSVPSPASFCAGEFASEPHLTLDGRYMFFGRGEGTWWVERTPTGWSEPQQVPGMITQITSDRMGHLYGTDMSEASQGRMYLMRAKAWLGKQTQWERLTGEIEKARLNLQRQAHPCVAPDGSYLIFDDGRGRLQVSFLQTDGSWGKTEDLATHGFSPTASSAKVTPDGRFLFFSQDNDLYWVRADILRNLNAGAKREGIKE
jgi:hypothetical protein